MSLIFVDTEFSDITAEHPELISLGAVTHDGQHHFYVEIDSYDQARCSPFVTKVVEPLLQLDNFGCSRFEAARRFKYWVELLPENKYTVSVDFELDWELLADLLEGVGPKKLALEPSLLWPDLLARATLLAVGRGLNVQELFTLTRKTYYDEVTRFMIDNQLSAHHALNDARSHRAGYVAAERILLGGVTK